MLYLRHALRRALRLNSSSLATASLTRQRAVSVLKLRALVKMDTSPLGSPAGADGVSGVDTNALDEALAETPIGRLTRLKREKRLLARQQ